MWLKRMVLKFSMWMRQKRRGEITFTVHCMIGKRTIIKIIQWKGINLLYIKRKSSRKNISAGRTAATRLGTLCGRVIKSGGI